MLYFTCVLMNKMLINFVFDLFQVSRVRLPRHDPRYDGPAQAFRAQQGRPAGRHAAEQPARQGGRRRPMIGFTAEVGRLNASKLVLLFVVWSLRTKYQVYGSFTSRLRLCS